MQKEKPAFEVIPNWRRYSFGLLEPVQIPVVEVNHKRVRKFTDQTETALTAAAAATATVKATAIGAAGGAGATIGSGCTG